MTVPKGNKRHISLTQPLLEKLETEASDKGINLSELVRRILDAHYERIGGKQP